MDKNILGRALAKLNLMQKQLVEESQVLDELKAQEEADEREIESLRSELGARKAEIDSLKDELGKRDSEIKRLISGAERISAEFKNALDRERSDSRFNVEKLEAAAVEAEKKFQAAAEALRESLRQKTAEAARSGAELKSLLGSSELVKDDLERRLKLLQAENVSLREITGKQKSEIENLNVKLETGAAEAEKKLINGTGALKESLRQATAEAVRSTAEIKNLLGTIKQLKDDYEERLKALQAENDALNEGARKQKSGIENLFSELRNQAAEFNALLDKERAEDKISRESSQKEIRELKSTIKNIQHEQQKLTAEAEKLRDENAEIKALRDSALVKIMEMEMFSKSATSALKESRLELELLENSKKELSEELSKDKADFRRRLELARLELEEKKRQLDRQTRSLDAAKTENANLKAGLEGQKKKE